MPTWFSSGSYGVYEPVEDADIFENPVHDHSSRRTSQPCQGDAGLPEFLDRIGEEAMALIAGHMIHGVYEVEKILGTNVTGACRIKSEAKYHAKQMWDTIREWIEENEGSTVLGR